LQNFLGGRSPSGSIGTVSKRQWTSRGACLHSPDVPPI
jgi:hypothetical protein